MKWSGGGVEVEGGGGGGSGRRGVNTTNFGIGRNQQEIFMGSKDLKQ